MKNSSTSEAGLSEEREESAIGTDLQPGRFHRGSGRQRPGVEQHAPVLDSDAVGGDALVERGRRAAVFGAVLPAVPGAGDAAVNDLTLAERPALVGADVSHRRDAVAVAE